MNNERVYAALVAAGLIKNPRGEMLLVTKNDQWTLPTGHMKPEDTNLEEVLIREMKEELGLEEISIVESLGTIVRNKGSPTKSKSIEAFSCNISSEAAAKAQYEEGNEILIRPSQALELNNLDQLAKTAIERYLEKYPSRTKGVNNEQKEKILEDAD